MAGNHDWMNPTTDEESAILYIVEKTDVSPNQAKKLVAEHGVNRAKLLEVARTMKAEG